MLAEVGEQESVDIGFKVKTAKSRNIVTLMGGCGRLPRPEWFSQTHLKKTIPYVEAYLRSADTTA